MPIAFGTFDEPHAWLIRGLIEYGWPDVSRSGGYVPPGVFGGLDLSRLPETEGREGIVLEVPATVNGQRFDDDGTYHFQAQVIRSATNGQLALAVRCPEANYIQEFAYDATNPTWAAGFIHQALTQYVPQFIQWRQQGGEVTWAQRQGIVEMDGEPCSGPLSGFVAESIRAGRSFDRGPAEGWWVGSRSPLSTAGGSVSTGPAVPGMLRQGGPTPVQAGSPWPAAASPAQARFGGGFAAGGPVAGGPVAGGPVAGGPIVPGIIAGGPIAAAGTGLGRAQSSAVQAQLLAEKPGTALLVMSALGGAQGLFWFFNALSIIVMYRHLLDYKTGGDEIGALVFSVVLSLLLVPTAAVAGFGAWQYRKGIKHPLGWVAIGFSVLVPGCCVGGIPVAIWAAKTWSDPVFNRKR